MSLKIHVWRAFLMIPSRGTPAPPTTWHRLACEPGRIRANLSDRRWQVSCVSPARPRERIDRSRRLPFVWCPGIVRGGLKHDAVHPSRRQLGSELVVDAGVWSRGTVRLCRGRLRHDLTWRLATRRLRARSRGWRAQRRARAGRCQRSGRCFRQCGGSRRPRLSIASRWRIQDSDGWQGRNARRSGRRWLHCLR